jgi:hypothetical protein
MVVARSALVRVSIVVPVAIDFIREMILFAVQLLVLPAAQMSAVVCQIPVALIVQAPFLALQAAVFAGRQLTVAHAVIDARFLARFAVAHFARLCGNRSEDACRSECGECEFAGADHECGIPFTCEWARSDSACTIARTYRHVNRFLAVLIHHSRLSHEALIDVVV